jgi:hypothetical protein
VPGVIAASFSPGPPEILWHYASAAGLNGIVESKTLWASDTLRMTDPREYSYSREMLLRVIDRMKMNPASPHESWMLEFARIIAETPTGPTVYAACTSEAGDLRSQWDVFAESGTGFAIGLDRRVLYEAAAEQGYSLFPVIYDVTTQEAHFEKAVREVAELAPTLEVEMGRGPQMTLLLAVAFCYPLAFVKNHRFVEEREWRLMRLEAKLEEAQEPKVRETATRYEEVSIDCRATSETALTHVVAGPHAGTRSVKLARQLLNRCGLVGVPVTHSALV